MDREYELHVRFGVPIDGPREVETFRFETKAEQKAFIDGMYALHSRGDVEYDIARSPEEPDPEWEDEDEG
jgi:hypothetical protein